MEPPSPGTAEEEQIPSGSDDSGDEDYKSGESEEDLGESDYESDHSVELDERVAESSSGDEDIAIDVPHEDATEEAASDNTETEGKDGNQDEVWNRWFQPEDTIAYNAGALPEFYKTEQMGSEFRY